MDRSPSKTTYDQQGSSTASWLKHAELGSNTIHPGELLRKNRVKIYPKPQACNEESVIQLYSSSTGSLSPCPTGIKVCLQELAVQISVCLH